MGAMITGRGPRYTQSLHGARTARAQWQERPLGITAVADQNQGQVQCVAFAGGRQPVVRHRLYGALWCLGHWGTPNEIRSARCWGLQLLLLSCCPVRCS